MAPRATTRRYPHSHSSLARARAAVIAVGVGASLVLGAGVTFAADATAAGTPAKVAEAKKKADVWETPVAKYTLGAAFGLAGNLWSHNHSGQDFVVPSGTPVRAVHTGVVVKAGPNGAGDGPAYGNAIVIKHDNDTYTQYAHLSRVDVRIGQSVTTGQQIGLSGSTGNSTGPHLHFEVRTTPNYGSAVGPLTFLREHGVKI
ncbi:putative secreted metallopeptidase [Streptomyces himastatinicus ATCC 53653]|uniref:Putative secreted metallopeptidase n=1 Tax=Streptomyces himastatinicus ATCC 53653 TaxID=457427 RepID=D9WSY7_9ACTN|nr:M23 family metallopeptidase [Streptomyces himastatinicus]EFL24262.1 putative secreted metallopeptidase [Streptomyces himastatinicus ATCC 53653]